MQELCECKDACETAKGEHGQHRPVQVAHGAHHIVILAHHHQDETAGDARKDHGAYGDGSAQEYEEQVVRSLRGRERAHHQPQGDACKEEQHIGALPAFQGLEHEKGRSQDQPEEECPGGHGIRGEAIFQQLCQREDAEHHTDAEGQQEPAVNLFPELLEISVEEFFPGVPAENRVQGLDDPGIDPGNEGYCASGNARNHVSGPHEEAFDSSNYVTYKTFHFILSRYSIMAQKLSIGERGSPSASFRIMS